MNFNLRTPCDHCPFRRDRPGFLRRERAIEITESITSGADFACHKTTRIDPEDDSEMVVVSKSEACAGALILLEKLEKPTQMMRIAERVRCYDRFLLDMDAPVFDDEQEMIEHHDA